MGKSKSRAQSKLEELQHQAQEAEVKREEVVAREPTVRRLSKELGELRKHNHFTELFINTVGAPR